MEDGIVKTLKKVLCSILTLALMVIMFAGSGMEVKAEEGAKTFEYQERWSVIGAQMFDLETKTVSDAKIGDIITPNVKSFDGYEYVNTEFASAVFDEVEGGYAIKSWNADPEMNEGIPYLFHYYRAVDGSGSDTPSDTPSVLPSVSNLCLTDASYDSETKKIKATFTFDYSKMDGQWLFVFETENCQSWGELDWGWAAYGSGVASADSVFEVVDENEPLVIKSGKFYLPENREYMFPIDMSPITIDPKDPTANVVVFPSQPSGGPCGGGETEFANESASEPAQEVVQTPENNYAVFQEATIKNVEKAIEVAATNAVQAAATGTRAVAEPVKINTGVWISFKGNVYQKLQDSGLPVQITFMYKGERYRVDIPAGADLMSLVDENGYCGFLNLMAHFGGTKL